MAPKKQTPPDENGMIPVPPEIPAAPMPENIPARDVDPDPRSASRILPEEQSFLSNLKQAQNTMITDMGILQFQLYQYCRDLEKSEDQLKLYLSQLQKKYGAPTDEEFTINIYTGKIIRQRMQQ